LKHLELIDAPYKYDSHQCRTEHEKLEIEIDDFVKNFRKKKEIFAITEKVMKKEIQKDYYHKVPYLTSFATIN
jgi:hypothetical protein